MRAASIVFAIGGALWSAAPPSQALGFGRVETASALGQPLNFAAAVRTQPDEALTAQCISAEVLAGENPVASAQVRTSLEGAADSNIRTVRVSTLAPIAEPVVTISITLGCTAKITRTFVSFVDPPHIQLAQAAQRDDPAPAQTPAAADQSPVAVSPFVAAARAASPATAQPRRSGRDTKTAPRRDASSAAAGAVRPAARVAAAKRAAARREARASRPVRVVQVVSGGPRLQLETAPSAVQRSASAPEFAAASVLASAAAASAAAAAVEQLALQRKQVQLLEQGLASLRGDSQATQQKLAAVQAQLHEAQSQRYSNPLVYLLAGLSALLAIVVATLWWREARARRTAQWWEAQASTVDAAPADQDVLDANPPAAIVAAAAMPTDASRPDDAREPTATVAAASPTPQLSVEELIDLEQQVEFFVVLGQDEAAIDLLMSHVHSDGGISPLPYLKLLEIYRRRGDAETYEETRESFNRHFNAYAPDWDSDVTHGRVLADYPGTVDRLQGLWHSPVRAMEMLNASLFRRDVSEHTFDLPAYGELLFLYSVARDISEHPVAPIATATQPIDLLLPIDDDTPSRQPTVLRAVDAPPRPEPGVSNEQNVQSGPLPTLQFDLQLPASREYEEPTVVIAQATPHRSDDRVFASHSKFIDFDLSEAESDVRPVATGHH